MKTNMLSMATTTAAVRRHSKWGKCLNGPAPRPSLIVTIDLDQIYAAVKFQAQRELKRITADVRGNNKRRMRSLSPTLARITLAASISNCFIRLLKLLYVVGKK